MVFRLRGTNAQSITLRLDDETSIAVIFRRSERAKRVRIVVTQDKVEAIAPANMPEERIISFVKAKQDWIIKAHKSVQERSAALKPLAPQHYEHGAKIPYRGKVIPLVLHHTDGNRIRVTLTTDPSFHVYMSNPVAGSSSDQIRRALEAYMKQQARILAFELIDKHGPRHQLYPSGVRIKTLKSKWGSCSAQNNINLNWLLLLGPPEVFEYVIVHELCHIKHKNHSNEFWKLVYDHLPAFQIHRRWLKTNGSALMAGL